MNFVNFKNSVAKQFEVMQRHDLYTTSVDPNSLWETYLKSFPEGTNPLYRKRTEHDCSCCKQFIRAAGNIVAVINGQVVSIWDVVLDKAEDQAYQSVAHALSTLAKSAPIYGPFFYDQKVVGTDKNFEQVMAEVKTWNHFHLQLPASVVKPKLNIPSTAGKIREKHAMALRAFTSFTTEALGVAQELITSIYRGEEWRNILANFTEAHRKFAMVPLGFGESWLWENLSKIPDPVAYIRNTAFGTLLVDLSDGVEVEKAVGSYEQKLAPTNYRRPTALVTKSMVETAKKALDGLGLASALERRYANIDDISINNLLFADRSVISRLKKDGLDGLLDSMAPSIKIPPNSERISAEDFIRDILPKTQTLDLLVENSHRNNLVSLIAPVHTGAAKLFSWDNPFSWSYTGDVTDSIKERVKKAGGNVTGVLCCRLSWEGKDDLDLSMEEPSGNTVYWVNKGRLSAMGGKLDVDANGSSGMMDHPVENIYYSNSLTMKSGNYRLRVHNYSRRDTIPGFTVEIELEGKTTQFHYANKLGQGVFIDVANIGYYGGKFTLTSNMNQAPTPTEFWGIKSNELARVSALMVSPNHWDNQLGNKHLFFMLKGCKNGEEARGFYNEFLRSDLNPYRKAMEMVGTKLKTDRAEDQLSGLGFSSTVPKQLIVRVNEQRFFTVVI